MMRIQDNKVLIQIGTNTGADEFNGFCRYSYPSKVILVEPQASLNEAIKQNYKDIKNVIIENVAITDVKKEEVTLVIPKDHPEMWGIGNYTLLPMDDWGNDFEKITVPGITFNQLCEKHNINDIHLLMIDTEGFDCEIIKSIDFDKINIDIIMYEKWGFSTECFSRHGDKAKLYEIAGMKFVEELLTRLGYTLQEEKCDIIAIKN